MEEDEMVWILSALCVVFISLACFFGVELLKKFRFMKNFIESRNRVVIHEWPGSAAYGCRPGMRNIVIRAKKPFTALVGFELGLPFLGKGFDYFGFVRSDENGLAVVSMYCGRGPVRFMFLLSVDPTDTLAEVTCGKGEDQDLKPMVTYPPYWYQTIGFYG